MDARVRRFNDCKGISSDAFHAGDPTLVGNNVSQKDHVLKRCKDIFVNTNFICRWIRIMNPLLSVCLHSLSISSFFISSFVQFLCNFCFIRLVSYHLIFSFTTEWPGGSRNPSFNKWSTTGNTIAFGYRMQKLKLFQSDGFEGTRLAEQFYLRGEVGWREFDVPLN